MVKKNKQTNEKYVCFKDYTVKAFPVYGRSTQMDDEIAKAIETISSFIHIQIFYPQI